MVSAKMCHRQVPGVATTGILTFVGSWNAYMLPLFVLSDANKYTCLLYTSRCV